MVPNKKYCFNLHCAYQNVGGFNTKLHEFFTAASSSDCDIIAVAETWATPSVMSSEIIDSNVYTVYRSDRRLEALGVTRGGGVLLAVRNSIHVVEVDLDEVITDLPNIDIVCCKVRFSNNSLYVFVVYIPPNTVVEHYTHFFECLTLFEELYGSNIVVFGDFNIANYVKFIEATGVPFADAATVLLDRFLGFFDLKQFNNIRNSLGRILDLVIANVECTVMRDSAPMLREDRHHPALYSVLSLGSPSVPSRMVYNDSLRSYDFRKANFQGLYAAIGGHDWTFLDDDALSVDEACELFYNAIYKIFDAHIPMKNRSGRVYPPWYTAAIKRKLRYKYNIYRKFKRSNSLYHLNRFKQLRLEIKNEVSAAYAAYLDTTQQRICSDPSIFWSFIHNKGKSSRIPSEVNFDGSRLDNPQAIVEGFASCFKRVYTAPRSVRQQSVAAVQRTVDIDFISEDDVKVAVKQLKSKLSQGPDGMPSFLIKDCCAVLCGPLSRLFNSAIRDGIFPQVWKVGKVCPVFKSGSRDMVENYRPVTVLSVVSRVFEKVLYNKIFDNIKETISDKQHGFMRGRSTITNLTCLTQFVSETLDDAGQVDVIYTDFSKAFDRIDHNIILFKLGSLGFSDSLMSLLGSYLSNRQNYVQYLNYRSTRFSVLSGVPQGSILGPLLFNIYMNDVCDSMDVEVLLYADDMKIYRKIDSVDDCLVLQGNVNRLERWCQENNMPINVAKCRCVTFSRKSHPCLYPYHIANQSITRTDSIRDLGVTFDSQLSFNAHVESIVSSANRSLGFIMRSCKEFTDLKCLKLLFFSFVRSQLEYASVVWSPFYSKYRQEVESIQRRFLKYLSYRQDGVYPVQGFPNSELLDRFGVASLEDRRNVASIIFFIKLLRGGIDCGQLRSEVVVNVPAKTLRNNRLFVLPSARTNVMLRSPLYVMFKRGNILNQHRDVFNDPVNDILRFVTSRCAVFR